MMLLGDVLKAINAVNPGPGDFVQDGLVYCGDCHEPKQQRVASQEYGEVLLPRPCLCGRERSRKDEERRKKAEHTKRVNELRWAGLWDPSYRKMTFDKDDSPTSPASVISRRYLANWGEMRKSGCGILYHGSVGTGKTFYAACIANELMERNVAAYTTTIPRILGQIQAGWNAKEIISTINSNPLLVIDDLGTERNTDYALEQLFAVIDARSMSHKPTIITTNLSMQELTSAKDLQHKRIYDRVLEMCPIRVRMVGPSRRESNAKEKAELAARIMGGG